MKIRKAIVADIDGILDLLVQVNMVHHKGRPDLFKGPTTKYSSQELEKILEDVNLPIFVCVEDEKVLGHAFCVIQEHKGERLLEDIKTLYIDDICVNENERGRHIGQSLYEYVIDYAKSIKCYNVTLNVWECNPGAKAFYETMGMKVQKTGMEFIL